MSMLHKQLKSIQEEAPWADQVIGRLKSLQTDTKFLYMFSLWIEMISLWGDYPTSIIQGLEAIWRKKHKGRPTIGNRLTETWPVDVQHFNLLAFEMKTNIQHSKLYVLDCCNHHLLLLTTASDLLDDGNNNILMPNKLTIENLSEFLSVFLAFVHDNLNHLLVRSHKRISPFKKQIETIKEKLMFLQNLLEHTANCKDTSSSSNKFQQFHMFVQLIANHAGCLSFLYWAHDSTQEEANDKIATEMSLKLSHMLHKIKPATTPVVARLYFQTLEAIYLEQQSHSFLFGETASIFVDLIIEDQMKRDFQTLQDDILFLLTFLNYPPNGSAAKLICSQVDLLFWEGLCGLLPYDDAKHDFFNKKVLLSDFVIKIQTVNTNIKQLYCMFPDSSLYNFPMVVSPHFLDFLIENLRNLIERMTTDLERAAFAKHQIIKIVEELVSLRPSFNLIFKMQSELNATWLQVVHLIHLTEHVIDSCISSCFDFDQPIWYHVAYLSEVFQRLTLAKTKLENITKKNTYNATCLPDSTNSEQSRPSEDSTQTEQIRPSEINEVVVGFEDEAEEIITKLTCGQSLDTIAIVGMGGLGKTTIAKKVYGSSLVKSHFYKFAFCIVSQYRDARRILLDILRDIKGLGDKYSDMTDVDDLAHELWKNLSRRKYLIVLDDMWDISVWNKVKASFPDDKNGSRVMFTTRSREVADKCKIICSPHHLRFLTEDESWELLRKKVFHNGISPPNLYDIGKLISKKCKGLPLAVAVIAGLLARIERNQSSWRHISERLSSYLSEEGCMDILELSFKHLPEYLKPCLIYLGAYPQDSLMKVKQVILLWIAEGFVPKSKTKRLEDVAKEYFHDLVDRSLVIVNTRCSDGGIKTFLVHDLIHDLCQTKCQDGHFFQLRDGIAASSSSLDDTSSIYNNYRVSVKNLSDSGLLFSNARSVLVFHDYIQTTISKEFRLAHVLQLENISIENQIEELTSLIHVRHIEAKFVNLGRIPSSITSLRNVQSLILDNWDGVLDNIWEMKSLRHVKVTSFYVRNLYLYSYEHEVSPPPQLDKVVSFSWPILSNGEDVKQLLQRLPALRELSCQLKNMESSAVDTLDFYRKLESLKLVNNYWSRRVLYLINFPSTLKKLTLEGFQLPWTAIAAIAELHCLRVLKLRENSFPGDGTTLDISEEVVFENLIFFELKDTDLVQWNVTTESFPCLEHFVMRYSRLQELPPCFGEMSSLKRIDVRFSLYEVEKTALEAGQQQMELGNKVEVLLTKDFPLNHFLVWSTL